MQITLLVIISHTEINKVMHETQHKHKHTCIQACECMHARAHTHSVTGHKNSWW